MEYSNLQVFPLHELPALEKLQRTWVRAFLSPQPLDDICKYFGVKITMYFAWLGHYTTALIVPAAVGAIYWVKREIISHFNVNLKKKKNNNDYIYIYIFLYSNLTYADRHHRQESSGRRRGLCTFLGLQRNLGHRLFGNLEKKGRRIGLQVGHFGSKRRPTCRAQAFIHGKLINVSTHHLSSNLLIQVSSNFISICFLYLSVYFFTFFFLSLFP